MNQGSVSYLDIADKWKIDELLKEIHERIGNPNGSDLIAQERARQIEEEGWTAEHDEEHATDQSLTYAAIAYAFSSLNDFFPPEDIRAFYWPWDAKWWKPKDPLRDLIRAGALIAARIDQLKREQQKAKLNSNKGDTQ
jgi:hypothetical protein